MLPAAWIPIWSTCLSRLCTPLWVATKQVLPPPPTAFRRNLQPQPPLRIMAAQPRSQPATARLAVRPPNLRLQQHPHGRPPLQQESPRPARQPKRRPAQQLKPLLPPLTQMMTQLQILRSSNSYYVRAKAPGFSQKSGAFACSSVDAANGAGAGYRRGHHLRGAYGFRAWWYCCRWY